LHDEVMPAIGQLSERENVHDVRVSDAIGGARFLDEPVDRVRTARILGQDLDRDLFFDDRMDARVDRAHPASAEHAGDAVLAHHCPFGEVFLFCCALGTQRLWNGITQWFRRSTGLRSSVGCPCPEPRRNWIFSMRAEGFRGPSWPGRGVPRPPWPAL